MILTIEQELDEFEEPQPILMKYTEAAKLRLKEWYIKNYEKQNTDCEEYATQYSKQTTYLHKFAGLFNVITTHCKSEQDENLGHIGNNSLERAIKLVKYFENAHKGILGVGIQNEVHRLLKEDLKREVYSSLPKNEPFSKFQVVDLWTKCVMRYKETDYLNVKEQGNIDKNVGNWLKRHKDELFKKDRHNLYEVIYPEYDF